MATDTGNKSEAKRLSKQRRIENLKPCKPGETHNPGGRPKSKEFRQFLLDWLAEKKNGRTNQLALVERLAKTKPEYIFFYAHGKPVETVEISGRDGKPIEVEHATAEDLRAELARRGITNPILTGRN